MILFFNFYLLLIFFWIMYWFVRSLLGINLIVFLLLRGFYCFWISIFRRRNWKRNRRWLVWVLKLRGLGWFSCKMIRRGIYGRLICKVLKFWGGWFGKVVIEWLLKRCLFWFMWKFIIIRRVLWCLIMRLIYVYLWRWMKVGKLLLRGWL